MFVSDSAYLLHPSSMKFQAYKTSDFSVQLNSVEEVGWMGNIKSSGAGRPIRQNPFTQPPPLPSKDLPPEDRNIIMKKRVKIQNQISSQRYRMSKQNKNMMVVTPACEYWNNQARGGKFIESDEKQYLPAQMLEVQLEEVDQNIQF